MYQRPKLHSRCRPTCLLVAWTTSLLSTTVHGDYTGTTVAELPATCAGATRYALYANFDDPQDELVAISSPDIKSSTGFVEIAETCLPIAGAGDCDSYVTIGLDSPLANTTAVDSACVVFGCFNEILGCGLTCSWFNSAPGNGIGVAGADGQVLIAVIAVPDDGNGNPGTLSGGIGSVTYIDADTGVWETPAGGSVNGGPANPGKLILLDRTGSMNIVKPNGMLLCDEAFFHANQELIVYSLTEPNGLVSVWTFEGNAPTDVTGGWVSPAQAQVDLAPFNSCSGATPLAETICSGVDEVLCRFAAEASEMLIITDGEENNSDGMCSGPASIGLPPPPGNYDAGSWHQKVYDKVIASGIPTTTWLWDPNPFAAATAGAAPVPDDTYFEDLSNASGGYFVYVLFNESPPAPLGGCCFEDGSCQDGLTVFACLNEGGVFAGLATTCAQCSGSSSCGGDLNGDGRIDVMDLVQLIGSWGPCPGCNADLDQNGAVDVLDLVELLGHWGPCDPV